MLEEKRRRHRNFYIEEGNVNLSTIIIIESKVTDQACSGRIMYTFISCKILLYLHVTKKTTKNQKIDFVIPLTDFVAPPSS